MPAMIPFMVQQAWMSHFSKKAIRAGSDLDAQEFVDILKISPDGKKIAAFIDHSDHDFLEMEIEIKVDQAGALWVNGSCTCATHYNCKHVAGALFTAMKADPKVLALLTGMKTAGTSSGPALGRELTQWLTRLEQVQQVQPAAQDCLPTVPERILYILGPECDAPGRIDLRVMKTRVLKKGGFGATAAYGMHSLTTQPSPRFVLPVDARIGRLLQVHLGVQHYGNPTLTGEEGSELLELMVGTGRCFWASHLGAPLTLGEPRPATPGWLTDEEGRQSPILVAEPPATQVLPVTPPWYYDAPQGTVGRLQMDLPPAFVQSWLNGPEVTPQEAAALNEALVGRFPTLKLPKAQAVEIEELPAIPPTPALSLGTVRLQWWEVGWSFRESGLDGTPVHLARPTFLYHGARVLPKDPNLTLERMEKGRLVRTRRDPTAELRLLNTLSRRRLAPAESVLTVASRAPGDKRLENAWVIPSATGETWLQFLDRELPALEAEGWIIEYEESFALRLAKPQDWYAEVVQETGNAWFDLELGVQVDGTKINLLPVLLKLLQSGSEDFAPEKLARLPPKKPVLIPLEDGRQLPFPAGRLHDILATLVELYDPQALNKKGRLTLPRLRAAEVSAMEGADNWKWHNAATLRELGARLKDFHGLTPAKLPATLQAELRPYQQDGLTWLQFLREYDLAGILADDMGLGKTVQALAHILAEKEAGRLDRPCLVVAPTSLMTNWRQETERFAPTLKVLVSHGVERKEHHENLAAFDLIVTSYALLPFDQDVLTAMEFHLVILDEAQYIKNPKTRYAQIACVLKARHRLCLTGTPLENHLGELWSQFNFLLPGFLGDETRFRVLFRNPIEKSNNADRRQVLGKRVAPFILRRRKEQVMQELPPKTEIVHQVELEGAQRDLYESIRLAMHARVRQEIQSKGMNRSQIIILDALLKLRQVCCDPRLVPLEAARHVQESAKLGLLMDLLPEMVQEGRRILLFSQFTSMLALIERALSDAGIKFVKLTGETTDRATPVHEFQAGKVPVFLISLRAGGTGLNLTAADTVIHYDPWWNPAVENQATDRAHRIGQDKKVFVYKLMTIGTVEEKIGALQAKKRELVEGLLGEGAQEKLALTAEDLDVLFAPLA